MKNFLTILLLIYSISFTAANITYAVEDIDGDSIIDEIDTENTYYNVIDSDLHEYFLYDFSDNISSTSDNTIINNVVALSKNNYIVYLKAGEREYISLNNIGKTRVDAFKNKQEYFYISTDENKSILKESEIIKHVCKKNDIDNNSYSCEELGKFSENKFKATSNIDTDRDGVKNFDTDGNLLDLENTNNDNIRFICTSKDIENQNDKYEDGTLIVETLGYECSNTKLGVFSEIKKSYFTDTDRDGVGDYLDKELDTDSKNIRYICTPKDIENQNDSYSNGDPILETIGYNCNDSQLGKFSEIKYSNFIDSDDDGISDYDDQDDNTNSNDLKFICTENNIKDNKYNCTDNQLGIYSATKFSYFHDADDDGISDYEDQDNNTNSNDLKFICTKSDIENNKYNCSDGQLGILSNTKADNFKDSDNDGVSDLEDKDNNTNSDDLKYICTSTNIKIGLYGCNTNSLGVVSQQKKDNAKNLDELNSINDGGGFGFEKGQSQSQSDLNLQTGENKVSGIKNDKISALKDKPENDSITVGEEGIKFFLLRIAKDLKNLFFVLASIYLLVLILKIFFTDKTEEASNNLKKGGLWISLGLVVMQVSYPFIKILFDKGVSENLAEEFAQTIFSPFISLLETAAGFLFIGIAIYSFYKLVTANGNEEAIKSGKMSIVYAIMGFIVIKLTKTLVNAIYGKVNCSESSFTDIIKGSNGKAQCLEPVQLEGFSKMIVDVINWANGFIGIILVVLVIYTGARVLLSTGNEDTLKSSKSTFIYIAIGVGLLFMNYLILTFFLLPENPIG